MRAALPSLFLAFVVVGCATPPQQVGGVPRTGRIPPVVSLSPSTTEIVASNFSGVPLVGRTAADNYPANVTATPVVAETKPDWEKIKKASPGLIVYDADLFSDAEQKRLEEMAPKTFAFKARTVEGFEREMLELAGLLGSETVVNDNVTRIERARSSALANPLPTKPKVAVVLGGKYVAGTNSFVADVVRIAGGEPVGPPTEKFDPMSPEALVTAQPDVIVLPTTKENGAKDLAALKSNPALASSPAMKQNRVLALDQDVVLRRGARVERFILDLHAGLGRLFASQ